MILTPDIVRKLQSIISKYAGVVGIVIYGPDAAPKESIELAIKLGLIDKENPHPGLVRLLHAFGSYAAAVGENALNMGLDEFRELVAKHRIPQTPQEKASATYAATRAATAMQNATVRLAGRVTSSAVAGDQVGHADLRSAVRDAIAARFGDEEAAQRVEASGVLEPRFFENQLRSTVKQVVSNIGHLTGEWQRDLTRIVHTETTAAVQQGQTARWEAQEEQNAQDQQRAPRDVIVYKLTRPGFCKHCGRLHLDGGFPRLYLLSEAQGNGDNVGRRAADWRFVIGPVHPNCLPSGTPIITDRGLKAIEDILIGDQVWTHHGRWRPVTGLMQRQFTGDAVLVDGQLVTPEHPYLTSRGWRLARDLDQCDHLIEVVEMPFAKTNDLPPKASQNGFLSEVLRLLLRRRVPVTSVDFDRQVRQQRHVDQKPTHLVSGMELVASFGQLIEKSLFELGLELPCLCGSDATGVLVGDGLAARGVMSGPHDLLATFLGQGAPPLAQVGSMWDQFDTGRSQMSGDRLSSPTDLFRDLVDRLTGFVPPNQVFDIEGRPNQALLAHTSRHVHLSRKSVSNTTVYNFSVAEDESYVANGLVVHNCYCVLFKVPGFVSMPPTWRSGMAAPTVIDSSGRLVLP